MNVMSFCEGFDYILKFWKFLLQVQNGMNKELLHENLREGHFRFWFCLYHLRVCTIDNRSRNYKYHGNSLIGRLQTTLSRAMGSLRS